MKRISTLVGIIIIAITTVIFFGGVFGYQYFVTKIYPIVQSQQVQKQTAVWKTYTNAESGLSFQYPEVWGEPKIVRLSTRISGAFINGSINQYDDGFTFEIGTYYNQTKGENSTIQEIIDGIKSRSYIKKTKSTNIIAGGKDGIKIEYTYNIGGTITEIYIPLDTNGNIFQVSSDTGTIGADIFNKIISTFRFTTQKDQAAQIKVISPKEGETWKIGEQQIIKYTTSNVPGGAICIDTFVINSSGQKTPLTHGDYIGISKGVLSFKLGIGNSNNITPGNYKLELNVHACAETNNTFITSTTSKEYITILANPNFIKPSIAQINPETGRKNDVITILGNNLSEVTGILFTPIGKSDGYTAYTSIISKNKNQITFNFINTYGDLPEGDYQVTLISPTGNSNPLNFKFTK